MFDNSKLIITTDLEPDDILAIYIVLKHLESSQHSLDIAFIVGIGQSSIKRDFLNKWLTYWSFSLNNVRIKIYLGTSNSKKVHFSQDIFPFIDINPDFNSDKNCLECINEYLQDGTDIIALKPIHDLYKVYKINGAEIFNKSNLYLYGSFNLRSLLLDNSNGCSQSENLLKFRQDDFEFFLNNSFKNIYLYETHLNSINSRNGSPKNLPKFDILVSNNLHIFEPWLKFQNLWNLHIYNRFLSINTQILNMNIQPPNPIPKDLLKSLSPDLKNKVQFHYQVMQDIYQKDKYQFVLADIIPVLFFLNPNKFSVFLKPIKHIKFNADINYYTICSPLNKETLDVPARFNTQGNKIYLIHNLNYVFIDQIIYETCS